MKVQCHFPHQPCLISVTYNVQLESSLKSLVVTEDEARSTERKTVGQRD